MYRAVSQPSSATDRLDVNLATDIELILVGWTTYERFTMYDKQTKHLKCSYL